MISQVVFNMPLKFKKNGAEKMEKFLNAGPKSYSEGSCEFSCRGFPRHDKKVSRLL